MEDKLKKTCKKCVKSSFRTDFDKERDNTTVMNPLSEQNPNEEAENDNLLKLFVGGLNYLSLQSDIKSYFETFGKVMNCSLLIDKASSKSRGFAFVTIEDLGKQALKISG